MNGLKGREWVRKSCLDGDGDDDDTFLKKREDTNYNICFAEQTPVLEKHWCPYISMGFLEGTRQQISNC